MTHECEWQLIAETQDKRLREMASEIERLRAGIKAVVFDGAEHKPHPTLKDKCVHEHWDYDDVCNNCLDEYLTKLLEGP